MPPFEDLLMMLFGPPGSGKSSLAAGCPSVLFLATEPGQEFLEAPYVDIRDWLTFTQIVVGLKQQQDHARQNSQPIPYTAFAIDIVDNLHRMCLEFVCNQKGIAYPPKTDFGRTWGEITQEWKKWLGNLMTLGNVIFISHSGTTTIETVNEAGATIEEEVHVPTFAGNKAAQFLDGILNCMGFLSVNKEGQHIITFRKTSTIGAKDRTDILSRIGPVPSDWNTISQAYEKQAKEMGKEVKSRKG